MPDETPSTEEPRNDQAAPATRTVPPVPGHPKKKQSRLLMAGGIIALIVIIVIAAFFSISVEPNLAPDPGVTYPFTTSYAILIPEGQSIQIAGIPIIALTAGDEMIMKIGDRNEKFVVGETKTISERRALFTMLGITLFSTNYRIEATYRGSTGNNADFYLIIRTSKQVPSFLIERILPPEIRAQPA